MAFQVNGMERRPIATDPGRQFLFFPVQIFSFLLFSSYQDAFAVPIKYNTFHKILLLQTGGCAVRSLNRH